MPQTASRRGLRHPACRWAAALVSLALALSAAPAAPAATQSGSADAVDAAGPLDVTEVTLGQRDVRMALRIASTGQWDSRELVASAGRALCITLLHGEPLLPRARFCVTRRDGRTALDLTPLARDGTAGELRPLAADVSRPRPDVLEATFLPAAAGLAIGPYAWYADSAWTDPATCPQGCTDRIPDAGAVEADVTLLATVPCFGAAARDPARPCENPALRNSVEPPPDRAKVVADPYCDKVQHDGLITACSFGAPREEAVRTFALIGDSHAANLKTAVAALTHAKRWRGVSILRAGCPTTRARPILATPQSSRQCREWNRQVLRWIAKHPEVDTVILSAHASARVSATGGRSPGQAVRAGYREELRALLRQKRRIVVIRDTPSSTNEQLRCVSRALAARRSAQTACTRPRSIAVRPDPLMAAAADLGSSRITRIDLTRLYCDRRRCFSVIGGVLVRHDESHLTQTFAATLGPFIVRALDA